MKQADRLRHSAMPAIRVLLVGGSEADVRWARETLERSTARCFDLLVAHDLSEAPELIESDGPDLMLLVLSGVDAWPLDPTTESWLRAPILPIVVLSDNEDESFALRTLKAGALGFLVKRDVDTRTLVTTLEAALENHLTTLQLTLAREQAIHLATHDSLTNLANREAFRDRLMRDLASARRTRTNLAVLFLNVDGLKRINESLGHEVGDRLLIEVAERLTRCVRVSDSVARSPTTDPSTAISRVGGGEFTILLSEISDADDAARVATRVLEILSRPFTVDEHEFFITGSIGIAVYPFDGESAEVLVRNADTAMHQAKARARNAFQFYDKSMNAEARRRLHLESHLHRALDRGEFSLHYQPVRHASTGALVGAEALLRWNGSETGAVAPDRFIPIAERTGLIIPIGDWVLRTACAQGQEWQREGFAPIRIGVNLSGLQLAHPELADTVARTLSETELSPAHLELEITESTIMQNDLLTTNALTRLNEMGVAIALDDFGTGYSALSYLRRFPIDRLKIDRSFVSEIATNADDAALTAAVISLAHSLRLSVVAEGVETREQAELLRNHGCDELQGFLFSRAVPADEFVRFLDRNKQP